MYKIKLLTSKGPFWFLYVASEHDGLDHFAKKVKISYGEFIQLDYKLIEETEIDESLIKI